MNELNLNHPDLLKCSFEDFCESFGVDHQVIQIKAMLIDRIKKYCSDNDISQRKLASMVEGLTHDRVSKVFSGRVAHMTIDKLLQITHVLEIQVKISFPKTTKKASA